MTAESPKVLRTVVLLTIGLPYLALRGSWKVLQKLWTAVVLHRGLQILLSFLLFVAAVATWQLGPLVTGRLVLMNAAEQLAQASEGRNAQDMENDLRRKAFRLGFRGAITQRDLVSIERTNANGITICTITFEFRREVKLFGIWGLQVPVAGTVEEPVEPPAERKNLDVILVR